MLSVVLPCYNPPENWAETVVCHWEQLRILIPDATELIIVNDGSSVQVSPADISMLEKKIPELLYLSYPENKGKGYAIRKGMQHATGSLFIYTDIDFPYKIESIRNIYQALEQEAYDVAIGIKDEKYYQSVPLLRKIISRSLRYLTGIFLNLPVTDTQCGLKGFNRKALPVFLETKINRYLFDLEFINNSHSSKKLRITAIPVSLQEGVTFRRMNYRILIPELLNFFRIKFGKKQFR